MLNTATGFVQQILAYFDQFPENTVAVGAYIIGTLVILGAWYFITKPYPKFCGVTTLILFALLATPTVSDGVNASISPTICGILFGVLTHEYHVAMFNGASMFFVVGIGLLAGYCWTKFTAIRTAQKNTP